MMGGYRFAYPLALLLLAALPLLWGLWSLRSRRPVIRFSDFVSLRRAGAGGSWTMRSLLPILRSVALICLIVAVARPQRPDASTRIFAEGIAIQLVVDTSTSMNDIDLSPPGARLTRLDVVKQVVRRFVLGDGEELPGRPNDLIGLVRFAQFSDSICPLTLDHDNLIEVLERTQIVTTREEDGTAIGDGLGLAVERLKDLKRTVGSGEQLTIKSKVIILLTDGLQNAGMLTPVQAGELAAKFGIKVYTILAGTGRIVGFVRLPIDAGDLKKVSEMTGGRHYQATDRESLKRIYEEIDRLERTRVEERQFARWEDVAWPWLLAAFVLVSVQSLLDATWLRKIP